MKIELGPWEIELEKKGNYFHLGQVWCHGKELDVTELTINFKPREVPTITVVSLGREVRE